MAIWAHNAGNQPYSVSDPDPGRSLGLAARRFCIIPCGTGWELGPGPLLACLACITSSCLSTAQCKETSAVFLPIPVLLLSTSQKAEYTMNQKVIS